MTHTDQHWMQVALRLAHGGLGHTMPNPCVGCVIVKDNQLMGQGVTARGGRPHAETVALAQAGNRAKGSILYVTLEPCQHWGVTPPCTDSIIGAGVSRVVVAIMDPDKRMMGGGLERLKQAGIEVECGVLAEQAAKQQQGFLKRMKQGLPYTALKIASSLDGKIALNNGQSQWITGEAARAHTHKLRSQFEGIMVGTETALMDKPRLNCRLSGIEHQPIGIVLDRRGILPLDATHHRLVITAKDAVINGAPQAVLRVGTDETGKLDLSEALSALGGYGVNRLLIEGGASLAASLLARNLVDVIYWYHAPMIIGGDGRHGIDALGLDSLEKPAWRCTEMLSWPDGDRLGVYKKN
jgi:diaminohydroxyphosphoribosylaminopyrimidine deaminase / 5-amino-6-(5-phosphoribosylamino)uracil reductase